MDRPHRRHFGPAEYELDTTVDELFDKKFSFQNDGKWSLPLNRKDYFVPSSIVNPQLQSLKNHMNDIKLKLNDKNIGQWDIHTKNRNPAQNIVTLVRQEADPEFVTQAWAKFYEILCTYDIVNAEVLTSDELNSIHLCEAPGAFVSALNHYLKLNYPKIKWNWHANSLNPFNENIPIEAMITDDRFMLPTFDNWLFGNDNTGDIQNPENIQNIYHKSQLLGNGNISLVTADGSFNCMHMPEEQESLVASLLFTEAVTSLLILHDGGSLVIKMFTCYEWSSICLLYLFNCCFNQVHIIKPICSKGGNSEVYVACTRYKRPSNDFLDLLKRNVNYLQTSDSCKPNLFQADMIPDSFINQIYIMAMKFGNHQEKTILDNIKTFRSNDKSDYKLAKRLRTIVHQEFKKRFKLERIKDDEKLINVSSYEVPQMKALKLNIGTHNDQLALNEMSLIEKFNIFSYQLNKAMNQLQMCDQSVWNTFISTNQVETTKFSNTNQLLSNNFKLDCLVGKPINRIRSSKFIDPSLMTLMLNIFDLNLEHSTNGEDYIIETSKTDIQVGFQFERFRMNFLNNYNRVEKSIVKEIICKLLDSKISNLKLINFLPLTQFTVSFLYLLATEVFERTTFNCIGMISFEEFKPMGKNPLIQVLDLLEQYKDEDSITCLSLTALPIINSGPFYQSVLHYCNYLTIKLIDWYMKLKQTDIIN